MDDECPTCRPLGCDCSDAQRPSLDPRYDANRHPDGSYCRCGALAAGGDCMCFEGTRG
jgi:hypothetical protein